MLLPLVSIAQSSPTTTKPDTLHYADQVTEKPRIWKEQTLVFKENYDGTGAGVIKVPAAEWASSLNVYQASFRAVADSLVFKFTTKLDIAPGSILFGRHNGGPILPRFAAERTSAQTLYGQKIWKWEIVLTGEIVAAFRERKQPFQIYFDLVLQ